VCAYTPTLTLAGTTVHVSLPANATKQQQIDAGAQLISKAYDANVSKITLDAGIYRMRQSSVVTGRELTIEGSVDAAGVPQSVMLCSDTRNDYSNNGDGTYTRSESANMLALFQSDPANLLSIWQKLDKKETAAEVAASDGTFAQVDGQLIVHPFNDADPSQVIQVPYASFGVMAQYGQVIVKQVHIRGARSSAAYGYAGVVELYDSLLMHNGWNGLDTTRKSSVRCERVAGIGNGNDGFGLHVDGVGTFINCYAANNADDGFSPHDVGQMRLIECVSQFNADRGIVAVGTANLTVDRCHLYSNGGQNISFEGNACGYLWDVIADTPGENQPNMRLITESRCNTYRVVDRNGQAVVPAINGCAKEIASPAQVSVDLADLAVPNLVPQWIQQSEYFQTNP
tara:strand:- start:156 stop:1352 length:1197 start_codon:yes stop_codon:yes gene_type:complete